MKSYNKLAIIAGFGSLPLQVINDAISKDWDVTIFSIDGSFKSNSKNHNIIELSYLNIKKIFNILEKNNIKNITMIGYIPRPNNMSAYLNLSNILFYLKFRNIMNSGDSSLFNNLIKFIEGKGYNIIGAHQISDNLTLTKGLYSITKIVGKENDNIKIANYTANKIGDLDIGQSVVVARERVLAVEAAEGTNNMLKRIIDLRIASPDKGGVFFKTSQNRISTSDLNQWFKFVLEKHPPPLFKGRKNALKYISQVNVSPPHFIIFCSHPDEISSSSSNNNNDWKLLDQTGGGPIVLEGSLYYKNDGADTAGRGWWIGRPQPQGTTGARWGPSWAASGRAEREKQFRPFRHNLGAASTPRDRR